MFIDTAPAAATEPSELEAEGLFCVLLLFRPPLEFAREWRWLRFEFACCVCIVGELLLVFFLPPFALAREFARLSPVDFASNVKFPVTLRCGRFERP